jgi:predicted aldo/keto reductase-like oxidoreductase
MSEQPQPSVSRRRFLRDSSVAAAGVGLTTLAGCSTEPESQDRSEAEAKAPQAEQAPGTEAPKAAKIARYRTLGRTGFQVSDLSMGTAAKEPNVLRYAYDRGVNYFDTAESYGEGDEERRLGEALQHMDRSKVFVTTKLQVKQEATEEELLDRFSKCQERLRLETVDALLMHSVTDVALLDHAGFHAAVERLKTDGRLKHAGVSSHGPRDSGGDSMEKVLVTAAEDGRFDLMLLVHNFMNHDESDVVLAACRAANVGTTAMKTRPGVLEVEAYDREHPTKDYADYIERMKKRGVSLDKAEERIRSWIAEQQEAKKKTEPFMREHGIDNEQELHRLSVQWVLQDDAMHTACLSLADFDAVDRFLPLSGTSLSPAAAAVLDTYRLAFDAHSCRHSCTECLAACPHELPVNTIMRYAYYFANHGREKHAMSKYAKLGGANAGLCASCDAPCTAACPHHVAVQAQMLTAHSLLTLA